LLPLRGFEAPFLFGLPLRRLPLFLLPLLGLESPFLFVLPLRRLLLFLLPLRGFEAPFLFVLRFQLPLPLPFALPLLLFLVGLLPFLPPRLPCALALLDPFAPVRLFVCPRLLQLLLRSDSRGRRRRFIEAPMSGQILTRRPGERAFPQHVQVQMRHRFTGIRAAVDHDPIT